MSVQNFAFKDKKPSKVTTTLHKILPLKWQRGMRDSGLTRSIFDNGGMALAAALTIRRPACAVRFFRFGGRRVECTYGPHPRNVLEVTLPEAAALPPGNGDGECGRRVLVFLHGGAWGSGHPWMYRLFAARLCEIGFAVVLVGCRVYPDANVDEQACFMADVDLAMQWLRANADDAGIGADSPLFLAGHSSGAHILALLLLRRAAAAQAAAAVAAAAAAESAAATESTESAAGPAAAAAAAA
ncbi:unnamed protein product, partial [Phaeothamnion confervicola]